MKCSCSINNLFSDRIYRCGFVFYLSRPCLKSVDTDPVHPKGRPKFTFKRHISPKILKDGWQRRLSVSHKGNGMTLAVNDVFKKSPAFDSYPLHPARHCLGMLQEKLFFSKSLARWQLCPLPKWTQIPLKPESPPAQINMVLIRQDIFREPRGKRKDSDISWSRL